MKLPLRLTLDALGDLVASLKAEGCPGCMEVSFQTIEWLHDNHREIDNNTITEIDRNRIDAIVFSIEAR